MFIIAQRKNTHQGEVPPTEYSSVLLERCRLLRLCTHRRARISASNFTLRTHAIFAVIVKQFENELARHGMFVHLSLPLRHWVHQGHWNLE